MRDWLNNMMQTEGLEFKIIVSLLIILILVLVRSSILKLVVQWQEEPKALYNWRKNTGYAAFLIGLILIFYIWLGKFQSIGTILGLFSARLVIALRDPLVNLAGFFFILIRRPLQVVDGVQIGEFRGDVIDIRIFQFTLNEIGKGVQADQSTGRIIHIPNGKVFTEMQANYSRGFKFIWNEIPMVITFGSNWKKAKQIFQEVVDSNTKDLSEAAEERLKEALKNL